MATGSFNDDGIHTPEQRMKTLTELREKQNAQAANYGWVNQKTGVVRLPIDRAIELTTPAVTVAENPYGFPTAITSWPTFSSLESPSRAQDKSVE